MYTKISIPVQVCTNRNTDTISFPNTYIIAIIRGGSYYRPKDGKYFPQAYRNDEHGKYILMADAVDRSATIGFRCVKDTEESAAALGNCSFFEE